MQISSQLQAQTHALAEAETPLKPLPHPVYFVLRSHHDRWQDLLTGEMPPPSNQLFDRFLNEAVACWTVNTYVQLKRRGLAVYLVPDYVPGQICVNAYDDLRIKDAPFNSYVVTCRHDRPRPEICEHQVVQNQLNILKTSDHYIPLWSQPDLKLRHADRSTKVQNLAYKGLEIYLASPFRSQSFLQQLKEISIEFHVSPSDPSLHQAYWTDYTEVDVVLAVRNCTEYDLSIKPPSKLINAWSAGCPALLGAEPAYQALRQSELDYIEVHSPQDVIDALIRLQNEPDLYRAMVENGFRRSQAFTPDRIAQAWRDLLAGSVAQGYERWLQQSLFQKVGRPVRFAWRSLQHKRERQYFFKHIHEGDRPFPENPSN